MFESQSYEKFRSSCSPHFPYLDEKSYYEITNIQSNSEVCGVIRDGTFIKLYNYSKHFESAIIDMDELKPLDILFHTHASENSSPRFSKRDILTGIRSKMPLLLYHPTFGKFDYWNPEIPHPYPLKLKKANIILDDYLNLPYQWVRSDCYTFCKDVAAGIYRKFLPDIYARQQSTATLKFFFMNPQKLGFKRIFNFREGCFVLMRVSVNIPFHMGIIVSVYEDNNVMMMHQIGDGTNSALINLHDLMGNIVGIYDFDKDKDAPIYFVPEAKDYTIATL